MRGVDRPGDVDLALLERDVDLAGLPGTGDVAVGEPHETTGVAGEPEHADHHAAPAQHQPAEEETRLRGTTTTTGVAPGRAGVAQNVEEGGSAHDEADRVPEQGEPQDPRHERPPPDVRWSNLTLRDRMAAARGKGVSHILMRVSPAPARD